MPALAMFRDRNRRGAAAVELAIIAPVFLLIVFGMIDFTRGYFIQAALSGAVRDAARYAAMLNAPGGSQSGDVKQRVSDFMTSAVKGVSFDTSLVSVTPADSTADSVRVTVTNYPIPMTTPLRRVIGLTGTSVTVTRSATFRHEVLQ